MSPFLLIFQGHGALFPSPPLSKVTLKRITKAEISCFEAKRDKQEGCWQAFEFDLLWIWSCVTMQSSCIPTPLLSTISCVWGLNAPTQLQGLWDKQSAKSHNFFPLLFIMRKSCWCHVLQKGEDESESEDLTFNTNSTTSSWKPWANYMTSLRLSFLNCCEATTRSHCTAQGTIFNTMINHNGKEYEREYIYV